MHRYYKSGSCTYVYNYLLTIVKIKEINMSIKDIIRAWKDSSFRASLSDEQRALLPTNPIGEVLSEEQLQAITGGMKDQCATDTGGCSCTGNEGCMITSVVDGC